MFNGVAHHITRRVSVLLDHDRAADGQGLHWNPSHPPVTIIKSVKHLSISLQAFAGLRWGLAGDSHVHVSNLEDSALWLQIPHISR